MKYYLSLALLQPIENVTHSVSLTSELVRNSLLEFYMKSLAVIPVEELLRKWRIESQRDGILVRLRVP